MSMTNRPRAIFAAALLALSGLALQPAAAQTPAGATIALAGARVIDGTGAAPIENATIVMSNGRIVAIGPTASVTVPAGATRVNGSAACGIEPSGHVRAESTGT